VPLLGHPLSPHFPRPNAALTHRAHPCTVTPSLAPRQGTPSASCTFRASVRSPFAISSSIDRSVQSTSSCGMLPPSPGSNSSCASCPSTDTDSGPSPSSSRARQRSSRGTTSQALASIVGATSGIALRPSSPPSSCCMSKSADPFPNSASAWSTDTSNLALPCHIVRSMYPSCATWLMLRHCGASKRPLLLDRSRCARNPEAKKKDRADYPGEIIVGSTSSLVCQTGCTSCAVPCGSMLPALPFHPPYVCCSACLTS
jgi:hypothetical protein